MDNVFFETLLIKISKLIIIIWIIKKELVSIYEYMIYYEWVIKTDKLCKDFLETLVTKTAQTQVGIKRRFIGLLFAFILSWQQVVAFLFITWTKI